MYGIDNVLLSTEDETCFKAAFAEKNEVPQRKMVRKYVHFFKRRDNKLTIFSSLYEAMRTNELCCRPS